MPMTKLSILIPLRVFGPYSSGRGTVPIINTLRIGRRCLWLRHVGNTITAKTLTTSMDSLKRVLFDKAIASP